MHTCSYCGIEFDPSEAMCPACGHKNEKSAYTPRETKKADKTYIKKEKKEIKAEKNIEIKEKIAEIKIPVKTPEDTGKKEETKKDSYEKALLRLEKSLSKEKEKKKPPSPEKSRLKKEPSPLLKPFYFSRISYLVWFFIGFTGLSLVSGYTYAFIGWFEKFLKLLFTSDISAEAELLNVHHRLNDLIPPGFYPGGSFYILNGDVLLFVPVFSCIIPFIFWLVKKRTGDIEIAGNSNIFTGLSISLGLSVIIHIILRSISFSYTVYDIILSVVLLAPVMDLGILMYVFKPAGFRLNQTIVVLLYNTGIPVLFIVISMAYDFISILIK